MENWTLKNKQEAEIKSIKERNISINLSDADVERLCKKAGGAGLTVPELLENFIGDLTGGTYSNGSDERMYANQWFDRCWFGMGFGETSFLQWLISYYDDVEEAVDYWLDLQCYREQEELDDDDKEDMSGIEESLNDLFNEYKEQTEIKDCSLETEMEKVMQWYEEMRKMKNSEYPKSALHPGEETAIINSIGGIQMNDNEILQAILTEIKGIKQKQDKMESDLSSVKNDVLKINLTLENETNKKIDLMYGSHERMTEQLKKVEQIDETKSRVSVLEGVVKKHSDDIRELKTKIG